MRCVMLSHTHWDREWYRTFQAFRARLVDTVDRVLDHRLRLVFTTGAWCDGFATAARLDETSTEDDVSLRDRVVTLTVPAHALRTVRLAI